MMIKYYGFGELEPNGNLARKSVLNVLRWTSPETAAMHMNLNSPSACLWIVPGTVTEEGWHVE